MMSKHVIIILSLDSGEDFAVEEVLEDGAKYLKATVLDDGELNRGVQYEYDENKSFEENLMDLHDCLAEISKTAMGVLLFGKSGKSGV